MAELVAWKSAPERKPVIVRGARQVGKTYALRAFGAERYENVVYFNLETDAAAASFFEGDIEPRRLVRMLEASARARIAPGATLLILDEIQSCPRALTSLKYFNEGAPEYHVAGAGSLLGVAPNRGQHSFPVGNVDSLTLHPLDFEEFLWAQAEERLADAIRGAYAAGEALPAALHERALELYRTFLVVGGMPRAVLEYLRGGSLVGVPDVQRQVVSDYVADMVKHATPAESVKIRAAFDSIPAQLAKDNKKFQYKVAQRGGTSAAFGVAIDWLEFAGIVLKCRKIEHAYVPVKAHEDLASFKLYMGDVGVLAMKTGLRLSSVLSGEEHHFQGALAENYVAQQLAAGGHELFYWASGNTAEVDFIVQTQQGVTAVEVKSGVYTRSRSLNQFVKRYRPERAVRLSLKPFGTGGEVMAVPLYAAFCL